MFPRGAGTRFIEWTRRPPVAACADKKSGRLPLAPRSAARSNELVDGRENGPRFQLRVN
jgi:hypothetical protein